MHGSCFCRSMIMAVVKEVISHILAHVNAEAADSDPSQVAGVTERAQYVRDAVRNLAADSKDNPIDTILQTISDDAPRGAKRASFRRALANMRDEPRPQLSIQAWVETGQERRGG